MTSLRKRRRIQMIFGGLALLAVSVGLIGYAMRDGIEFFRAPAQVAEARPADGQRFHLGGLVKEGSLVRGANNEFVITDGKADVPVRFAGILPALFGEGKGTIVKGFLQAGVFMADDVLAKHDENYMPQEVLEALQAQGVFQPST